MKEKYLKEITRISFKHYKIKKNINYLENMN
jgi:hypothetical protein